MDYQNTCQRQWNAIQQQPLPKILRIQWHQTTFLACLSSSIKWSGRKICCYLQKRTIQTERWRNLPETIDLFLLSYRTTTVLLCSKWRHPAEAFLGSKLRAKLDLLLPTAIGTSPRNTQMETNSTVIMVPNIVNSLWVTQFCVILSQPKMGQRNNRQPPRSDICCATTIWKVKRLPRQSSPPKLSACGRRSTYRHSAGDIRHSKWKNPISRNCPARSPPQSPLARSLPQSPFAHLLPESPSVRTPIHSPLAPLPVPSPLARSPSPQVRRSERRRTPRTVLQLDGKKSLRKDRLTYKISVSLPKQPKGGGVVLSV
uniref:Uncharacterized protein n=1 Tax=Ditylenchus dipsaci TaxID=166011 RepID=A0A915DNP9_9BILA